MAVGGITTSFSAYGLFGVEPLTTSSSDTLAKAFQAHAEKQITKKQQEIADRSQVEIDAAQREMMRWMPLTDAITSAQSNVAEAQTRVQDLDKTLFKMIGTLNEPEDGDWSKAAAKFDGMRSALNSAGNSRDRSNLLGSVQRGNSYKANQIEYQVSPNPNDQATVFGRYVGADFKITMSDGSFWMPSSTQQIQRYSSFPNGTVGYPQSTASGAAGVDGTFSELSLSFSVGKVVQPQQSYTGNLQREGLGILQSWLYDGLTTASGRARALEDIEHARDILKNVASSLEAAMTQVTSDLTKVQSHIDEQQQAMTSASAAANEEVQTYVAKAQAEVQAQLTAAINVGATPAVQMIKVGGQIGQLFDLLT